MFNEPHGRYRVVGNADPNYALRITNYEFRKGQAMKRNTKIFLRKFYISAVVTFCLSLGILGIMKAYEGIRLIGFGEYRSAIEIDKGGIKIFDFTLMF